MTITTNGKNWDRSRVSEFWSCIAQQHNVFHIYEHEDRFIDLLSGFVGTGINEGDCNIVIATGDHLEKLRQNLTAHGLHVHRLIEDERYFPIDASLLLEQFMVNERPNETLFFECINNVIKIARRRNRKVRTYREMVSVLRDKGNESGTRQLEIFWNKLSRMEDMLIFCAYPKRNFPKDECLSLKELGFANPKIVRSTKSITHVLHASCQG